MNINKRRAYRNLKRKHLKWRRRKGYVNHFLNVAAVCRKRDIAFERPPNYLELKRNIFSTTKPAFSETINYLAMQQKAFSKKSVDLPKDGIFEIPELFSLSDNNEDSFIFLKKLFYALHQDKFEEIIIDYGKCKRVDLDASICMDILLKEFSQYITKCHIRRFPLALRRVSTKNTNVNQDVSKMLLSSGAFTTLRGIKLNFPDMITYSLCIGNKKRRNAGAKRELDITDLMEYVLRCLKAMKKELTADAEDNLYKVIGEILINAEEHSDMNKRYSIGYFQTAGDSLADCEEGIFNLVIFNFGQTIYEKFKDPDCPNQTVVNQMKLLSEAYTSRNFFMTSKFEEETLWTLYSLQEGVTSHKDWKRGNGSIRFIDSFFKLKGNSTHDQVSKMTIMSGNARIVFDGTYAIIEKPKTGQRKPSKLMTFNNSGGFDEQPDKKFVNFADNYFPGTMIVAKIGIKNSILEQSGG